MNDRHSQLIDLINDPIYLILMKRDGTQPLAVLRLMKSIKPKVIQDTNLGYSLAA